MAPWSILLWCFFIATGCNLITAQGTNKILRAYYGRGYYNSGFACPIISNNSAIDVTGHIQDMWEIYNQQGLLPAGFTPAQSSSAWGPRPNAVGSNFLTVFYTDSDYANVVGDYDIFWLWPIVEPLVPTPALDCSVRENWYQAYWGVPGALISQSFTPVSLAISEAAYCELSLHVTQFSLAEFGVSDPAINYDKILLLRWTNCAPGGEGAIVGKVQEGDIIVFPRAPCP